MPSGIFAREDRHEVTKTFDLTQQPIQHVDATPDGGYALRILQVYRANCELGTCKHQSPCGFVNPTLCSYRENCPEQRAAELDEAIETLIEDDELRAKAREILTTLDAR